MDAVIGFLPCDFGPRCGGGLHCDGLAPSVDASLLALGDYGRRQAAGHLVGIELTAALKCSDSDTL